MTEGNYTCHETIVSNSKEHVTLIPIYKSFEKMIFLEAFISTVY